LTSTTEIHDYVRATARFLNLRLEQAQLERVAAHLARTQAMVTSLQAVTLPHDVETAEIFCPAPFPPRDDEKACE
jgi:hypothetical protein